MKSMCLNLDDNGGILLKSNTFDIPFTVDLEVKEGMLEFSVAYNKELNRGLSKEDVEKDIEDTLNFFVKEYKKYILEQ